jgi:hypothetical protein
LTVALSWSANANLGRPLSRTDPFVTGGVDRALEVVDQILERNLTGRSDGVPIANPE